MEKRVVLTIAMSMAVLFLWTKFFAPPPPPPAKPAAKSDAAAVATAAGATTKPGNPTGAPQTGAAAPEVPEEIDSFGQAGRYQSEWSTVGARPRRWELLAPQYRAGTTDANGKKVDHQVNLIAAEAEPSFLLLATEGDVQISPAAHWHKEKTADGGLLYTLENENYRVSKKIAPVADTYQLQVDVEFENRADHPLKTRPIFRLAGYQNPNSKPGGMFSQRTIQTEAMCEVEGKLKNKTLDALLKEPFESGGAVQWIGIDQKYFLAAIATTGSDERKCRLQAAADGHMTADIIYGEKVIGPGQKFAHHYMAYLGPKTLAQLDAVTVQGAPARLGAAVNYGWTEAIARPMLAILRGIYKAIPNWGIAVIALTLLLKLLTWWPTAASLKSMRKMAKLKPEIDQLKARLGEDKQRFNEEVMKLYKVNGINPLGGCLPMLIQMPIYIALYSMLGNSVELYRAPFAVWIHDLTGPDPYFVLPLLTGVLMFAQQRFSPTPPDPQQKAMMYTMPVMFTAFSIFLPAGLTLYILTNTLLSILQQWWLNRNEPKPARAVVAAK